MVIETYAGSKYTLSYIRLLNLIGWDISLFFIVLETNMGYIVVNMVAFTVVEVEVGTVVAAPVCPAPQIQETDYGSCKAKHDEKSEIIHR